MTCEGDEVVVANDGFEDYLTPGIVGIATIVGA